jgi:uroporphyrin-III C-methyltransferase / precorrin-2 dehydrogenase / sirohydrochlorin ferrochelatase
MDGPVHSLPLFVRLEGRPVILLGEGDGADAKRRLLERAGARIVGEDATASLAIVAIEDEGAAFAAVTRLKARGILVNAVDRPALCDFTLPAIVDRDPVLIAIGTGGASAGLAKSLRQRLEAMLPQALGDIATALLASRTAQRARWPDARDRRRAIDAAFEPGGPLDPFGLVCADAVPRWLSNGAGETPSAFHHLILTSDDPDDLTLRQARLMGQADTICHTPAVSHAILDRARADAARVACTSPPDPPPAGLTLFLERP